MIDKETGYEDWLKNLKAGDKVLLCCRNRYSANKSYMLKDVTDITKNGKIKFDGGITCSADGKPSKKDLWKDYTFELIMQTSERGKEILENKFRLETMELIRNVAWGTKVLSIEQLKLIRNVIEGCA